ncbi:hypothetical protein SNOG_12397 [Parastagonospora nodorum SN15]|uniref:Uncharacterized protein n=1 Tax=Phaeosphaeria nodorum (strain SN15 / ATCC MYA-4574 / FGSC 10173) TaxID=321614 RepID=Q0U767_PHANO|nr:hypothetical protein SNOG_12397 [Parastagonospora nodorum SN15]EAT80210.1 hypothetical protein SNOG_12397 [Parastagonospora nodorum SN15]
MDTSSRRPRPSPMTSAPPQVWLCARELRLQRAVDHSQRRHVRFGCTSNTLKQVSMYAARRRPHMRPHSPSAGPGAACELAMRRPTLFAGSAFPVLQANASANCRKSR